jgi:hypothetical protein
VSGKTLHDAIADGQGRVAKLVQSEPDDGKVIEELYWAAFGRPPTAAELSALALGENRLRGAQDLLWALLNSPAFLFNR